MGHKTTSDGGFVDPLSISQHHNCLHQMAPDGERRLARHRIQVCTAYAGQHKIALSIPGFSALKVSIPTCLALKWSGQVSSLNSPHQSLLSLLLLVPHVPLLVFDGCHREPWVLLAKAHVALRMPYGTARSPRAAGEAKVSAKDPVHRLHKSQAPHTGSFQFPPTTVLV